MKPAQQPSRLLAPVSASIPRYCFDHDKYWYIIEAKMEDGTCWELSRFYHDFYDFQIALLTQFEDEAGHNGRTRTLPFMPGPVTHVTDAISNGRRQNLDEYIKKLLAMPPYISRCPLVCQLFAPRPGDYEIDPNATEDSYRFSGESQQSSGHDISPTDSRQSSQARISASAAYTQATNGAASRAPHQRQQSSLSQQNSFASQSRTDLQLPPMNRQASSLTQASNNSNNNALKVKVFFQDDIIAIRVPSDVNFQMLQEKLRDRLKVGGDMVIQYRDEPTNDFLDMLSDHDLDLALQRNSKLTLRVSVA
jgi:bud emergence protein 1